MSGVKTGHKFNLGYLSGQRSHRIIYTIQIKEFNIEIFNFVVLPTIASDLAH